MRYSKNLQDSAVERCRATAALLATGVFRCFSQAGNLNNPRGLASDPSAALQSAPKQGSMSTVVNALIPGESRHGAKRRQGSCSDAPNDRG